MYASSSAQPTAVPVYPDPYAQVQPIPQQQVIYTTEAKKSTRSKKIIIGAVVGVVLAIVAVGLYCFLSSGSAFGGKHTLVFSLVDADGSNVRVSIKNEGSSSLHLTKVYAKFTMDDFMIGSVTRYGIDLSAHGSTMLSVPIIVNPNVAMSAVQRGHTILKGEYVANVRGQSDEVRANFYERVYL